MYSQHIPTSLVFLTSMLSFANIPCFASIYPHINYEMVQHSFKVKQGTIILCRKMGGQWQYLSSVALFLIISVLLPIAIADNVTYPTANQNLSPLQEWRSAEYCLLNTSGSCQDKFNYTLTDSGWLNVTHDEGQKFCQSGGCADHTRLLLTCLYEVKKDYKFANKATIKDLNGTINDGCDPTKGFTGVSRYSSHGFRLSSTPIISAALLFITFF